jgi:KUP system potassium uptake protein
MVRHELHERVHATRHRERRSLGAAVSEQPEHPTDVLRATVVVGALGVVFGDIGTSPIYTLQTVFNPDDPHPVPVSDTNVYGVVSLIFWSVTLVVTVTYVLLVMRIDNDGEGGIMALITLLRPPSSQGSASSVLHSSSATA